MGMCSAATGRPSSRPAREAAALEAPLVARGQKIQVKSLNSGLHAIRDHARGLVSGVDPRREGAARGE